MIRATLAVLRHELLLQSRQASSVLLFVGLAIVSGPLGLTLMDQWVGTTEASAVSTQESVEVAVVAQAPFTDWIQPDDHLLVVDGPVTTDDTLEGTEGYGEVTVQDGKVVLRRPFAVTRSATLESRVKRIVRRANRERLLQAVERAGESPEDYRLKVTAVARDASRTAGHEAGRILPTMLMFLLMSMATYTAVDVLTKEKEKNTAETLLAVAIDRRALFAGKTLIVTLVTLLVGCAWVGSLAFTENLGLLQVPNVFDGAVFTALNTLTLLVAVGFLSLQVSAVALVVASFASSFRAASILSMPAVVGLMVPAGIAAVPVIELTSQTLWIPVANILLAARSMMAGELTPALAMATFGAATLQTAGSIGFAAWLLRDVDPFDKGLDAESRRASGDYGPDAIVLFTLTLTAFWFFGTLLQTLDPFWGTAASIAGILGTATALGVAYVGAPFRPVLQLRPPSLRDAGLAVLIGLSMHGLGGLVALLISPVLETPEQMADAIASLADHPLPLVLLVGAVVPGVFEELFFRGAVMGLLRTRHSATVAVAVSALCFGFLHLDFARVFITAAMGLVLGVLVVRTRSLWTGIIAHTLNNGLLFTLSHQGAEPSEPDALTLAWLGATTVLTLALLSITGRSPQRAD